MGVDKSVFKNNAKNKGREDVSRSSTCTDEDSLNRFEDELFKCSGVDKNVLKNNPKNEGREDINIEDRQVFYFYR